MKLTQYNIDCMSASLGLSPALVQPMDLIAEASHLKNMWICCLSDNEERLVSSTVVLPNGWVKGRLPANSPGGRRGTYNRDRYIKVINTKKQNGHKLGRPIGFVHTEQTKAKMKIKSAKNISISKQKIDMQNVSCSCMFCKKQTSYLWLVKKHMGCAFQ